MKPSTTPSNQPTRAVIYCRISQDREGSHLGIDRQREDCEALAASRGWEVVEVYVDNDVSAYSGKKRKGYQRMLADLEQGMATAVIVWHTDRLHRSNKELEGYIDISARHGVSTHSVQSGELDLATSSGRMNARIVGAVAVHESEHKGERVARARLQKAKAGQWAGGIRPFGWGVPTGETRKKLDRATGEETEVDVLDMAKLVPEEAAAIETGHDMLLSGGSLRGWVKWLRDKGFTTTRGNEIGHVEARDMLLRPRNAGIAVYRGEEIGKGAWEPIVDEARHRTVVAILTSPIRRTTPGATPRWFGSGIYRCGIEGCTKTMKCTRAGGANLPSYRCPTQHGGARRADKLDRYIEDVIVERLSRDDAHELLLAAADGIDVGALQVESEEIRRRLTDLAAMFGAGQIDMAQFTEGTDTARAQLDGITQQMARAATKDPLVDLVGAPDVRKAWKSLDLDRRRSVLRALLDVTIRPARRGRMPDGGYFDYETIQLEWKRGRT